MALYDAATGQRIGFDDDSGPDDDASITTNLSVWTPYIVALGDWTESNQGDVNLNINGSTAWSSATISLDSFGDGSQTGLINSIEDTDFFSFTTPANVDTTGTVTVTPTGGTGLDPYIYIFDSNDNLVTSRNSTGANSPETISLSGLAPGETYRVGVQSNDFQSSGDVLVAVDLDTVIVEPAGIDFGPIGSPLWPTYEFVSNDLYSSTIGYGWTSYTGLVPLEESRGNDLIRDKVNLRNGTFVIDVDNGTYDVDVYLGVIKKTDAQRITIEGIADTFTPSAGPNVIKSYQVNVTDGQLTLEFDGLSGLNNRMNISGIGLSEVGGRPFSGGGDDNTGGSGFNYDQFTGQVGDQNDGRVGFKNSVKDRAFADTEQSSLNLAGSLQLDHGLTQDDLLRGDETSNGFDIEALVELTEDVFV